MRGVKGKAAYVNGQTVLVDAEPMSRELRTGGRHE
jgi:hypothetical protein